jgi:hypothetical protein
MKDYGQNDNLRIFPRFKRGQWVSVPIMIVHTVYDENQKVFCTTKLQIYQLDQLRKSEALAEAIRRRLREPLPA